MKKEFPFTGSLHKCLKWPLIGAKAGNRAKDQELHPGLPPRWQESNFLVHHHYLLWSAIAGSWSQEWKYISNPGPLI